MALTFSTAQSVLKEDYKDLIEQLNQEFFLLAQLEQNTDDVDGLRAYHALHVTRSAGVGSRASTGTLPVAGQQGYTQAYIPMRFHYGRIQVSGPVIKAMLKNNGAFVRAVDSEMKGITTDLKRDINRQSWGTADGVIATCGTTTAANLIVLAATTTPTQMNQLWAEGGMRVDIGTVANPVLRATDRAVTAIDTAALTITVDGAVVTTASTDRVFRTGNGGTSAGTNLVDDGQMELTGLQAIVAATGTLHGVNPSTYPVWKSYVDSNSGTLRSVSENLINKSIQKTELASGKSIGLLLCNDGVHRAIAADMRAMRRNIDNVDLKGGYSGIRWSVAGEFDRKSKEPKALKLERDCPNNKLFGLVPGDLVNYKMHMNFEWMEEDGAILSRVSNKDAYEASLCQYMDMAARARNSHFMISDLSEA